MLKQSLSRSLMILAVALVAAVVLMRPTVSAHHGWGQYLDQEFELSGTLETPVSLGGPHATAKMRVEGQVWDLTLAPGGRTQSAGLTEKTIPTGAKITAHGHRHRDAKTFEIKTERLTWNNKVYNVYPDRD